MDLPVPGLLWRHRLHGILLVRLLVALVRLVRLVRLVGFVDVVAMDVVPVVFGRGKRYFGAFDARQLLDDSEIVIQGRRVLHLRYRVRR